MMLKNSSNQGGANSVTLASWHTKSWLWLLVALKAVFLKNYLAVSTWILNGSSIKCLEKKYQDLHVLRLNQLTLKALTRHLPSQKADFVTKRIRHYRKLCLGKCTCISQCGDDKLEQYLFKQKWCITKQKRYITRSGNDISQSWNDISQSGNDISLAGNDISQSNMISRWEIKQ